MGTFIDCLAKQLNVSYPRATENGALGYRSTTNPLVDFNFKIPFFRDNLDEAVSSFVDTIKVDSTFETSLRYLFYLRDIRGGLGERAIFREIMGFLAKTDRLPKQLLELIPEYGRWDDLILLFNLSLETNAFIIQILNKQLEEDWNNMALGKPISLLAKWMPSIYKNSKNRDLAKDFALQIPFFRKTYFNNYEVVYRKRISELRGYLKIVERDMCEGNWMEIDYGQVPSKANLIYKDAFLRHDEIRRKKYLEDLSKGKTKINASVNFPHDVVAKYFKSEYWWTQNCVYDYDETLEQLWKGLPSFEGASDVLVVADTSGSMFGNPVSGTIPAHICFALAIYFAEHAKGQMKNNVMLFSSRPHLIDLSTRKSLRAKLEKLTSINDCSNTNIAATFRVLLKTAVDKNLPQEDLPKSVLVISDMEFDSYSNGHSKILFESIKQDWEEAGYKLPKLVFWNVASRTNTFPIVENPNGVTYLSGFSTNLVKMVLNNNLDPFEALKQQIFTERYNKVGEVVRNYVKI